MKFYSIAPLHFFLFCLSFFLVFHLSTCYPVASTNTKDFYNLVNVYLDAVLHPRAINDDKVLQQEGWHYELETASEPLTYKGVVYNEMKGVYSSPGNHYFFFT